MKTTNKRLILILSAAIALLSIPLIAMQFDTGVDWNTFDFVIMGILLLGTGLLAEFVMRTVKNMDYRIGIIAVILVALFLIWAELAVGIFGSPFAGS